MQDVFVTRVSGFLPNSPISNDEMEEYLGYINGCLLYTSDAADERSSVDLGGRRIIKKKKKRTQGG